MQSQSQTLEKFFKDSYTIPLYQRAYSWEKEQWGQFLADLEEVTRGGNKYYFGNVLLESLEDETHIDIIDGQQRITTILIFIRTLYNVLAERVNNEDKLGQNVSEEKFLSYLIEDFLVNRDVPKLQAVKYDNPYFQGMIITDNATMRQDPRTPSQQRIKGAKDFFIDRLKKYETPHILDLLDKVKNATVLRTEFQNKKDSVLIFELQNNRGKTLTHMERLKSYLAYQIYTYSKNRQSAERRLKNMARVFEGIYGMLYYLGNWEEDTILRFFNISYFKQGYDYNENDENYNYKRDLHDSQTGDKLEWIESYTEELRSAFMDF
ncbi:hypothetical protein NHP190012_15020 [Helicobacter sp. NHP19-012]|uniref:GmrSD restriction endonucleases N-terminal domain-containing protein n=1 Tax=Helicobacter gastrofelis TaxID=2849642 RepID=A0ABN6I8G2_9HELI|nr:DUF262 domain-containing protein [Helicobacter sp. NHP19-012]BCZ19860.1 hypothetical protein NHP190012_15020 [Helicobacter sp. NHP19-012]